MKTNRNAKFARCSNKSCFKRSECLRGDHRGRNTFQTFIWRQPDENGDCIGFLPKDTEEKLDD